MGDTIDIYVIFGNGTGAVQPPFPVNISILNVMGVELYGYESSVPPIAAWDESQPLNIASWIIPPYGQPYTIIFTTALPGDQLPPNNCISMEFAARPDPNRVPFDYFPLQLGNEWHYRFGAGGDSSTVRIQDTVSIAEESWFEFQWDSGLSEYYRPDSTGQIFRYIPGQVLELLFYDFEKAVGDSYLIQLDIGPATYITVVKIESRHDTVETDAGIFTDCIRLFFDDPLATDDEQWKWFAPEIGLVMFSSAWIPETRLHKAVINGIVYPPGPNTIGPRPEIPSAFALHQNYPNPFNPSTTLEFALPAALPVSLVIYDLRGRQVVTILDRRLAPGYHQASWDGRDATGRVIPSGIYLARLESPQYSATRKMLLLK